jgi:hypothetical protein
VATRAETTVQHSGRPFSSTEEKANIRANKPVPECRTRSHAVADDPLDGSLDEPERDGAGRSDTSCDSIELPGSQEVRGFESLRLHRKSRSQGCAGVATPSGPVRM